jgi:hypothetical protein
MKKLETLMTQSLMRTTALKSLFLKDDRLNRGAVAKVFRASILLTKLFF